MKPIAGYVVLVLSLLVVATGCQQSKCPKASRCGERPKCAKAAKCDQRAKCAKSARCAKMCDAKSPVVCGKWATSDFEIVVMDDIKGVECPCGLSRRAFVSDDNQLATLHKVDITIDSKTHYHKKLTEIYYILEADDDAKMELNGKLYPVKANTAILIKPGVRHRAVGKMKILNVPIPAFDPNDEWFD